MDARFNPLERLVSYPIQPIAVHHRSDPIDISTDISTQHPSELQTIATRTYHFSNKFYLTLIAPGIVEVTRR